jgi:hypothetical protein
MRRRPVSPFSLSFLDIMFCGFGAVVLLVLILNTDTVKARNQTFADLRADAVRLEEQVLDGQEALVRARNSLIASDLELVETQGDSERVIQRIRELEDEIAQLDAKTRASKSHIARLQSDLKKTDERKQRLGDSDRPQAGSQVHRIIAAGDRQYLTGLKVGGQRILILLDASASMLDETIINIIRRRNMDAATRRSAPKWQRAVATAEWLVSQLPATAKFQLYTFNTEATAVAKGSSGRWLSAARPEDIQAALAELSAVSPQDGTALYRAFAVAKQLSPRPDNILLITDGLPTQGRKKPTSTTVNAEQRLKHFDQAVDSLPKGVPVNSILMPMEGDAWAAAAFWRLALDTRGSFVTPARDWP